MNGSPQAVVARQRRRCGGIHERMVNKRAANRVSVAVSEPHEDHLVAAVAYLHRALFDNALPLSERKKSDQR